MAFFLPLLYGAIAGAAKTEIIDRPAAEKRRRSQLTTLKFSPHTGRRVGEIQQDPSTLAGAFKGALAGAKFGQANPGLFGKLTQNQTSASPSASQFAPLSNVSSPVQPTPSVTESGATQSSFGVFRGPTKLPSKKLPSDEEFLQSGGAFGTGYGFGAR